MKCPKCNFENLEGSKFCSECGIKLEILCPKCGKASQPGSKFCNECGHNLALPLPSTPKNLSFEEKLGKIQKYLPRGLTEKILAQRDKIEGERRQVTVMFCDLEGFTPLAEQLGPEETYSVMDKVLEILIQKVNQYEGTVNRMTGDGIMALFGAPIALEDAPQRGIHSALAIHGEIARFSDRLKQEKGMSPLRMRIGIHTGPVVVGTLGNDLRVEFTAVGDTVNLASRMEGLAEAGTTYVTEDTFKLTKGFFRFEALGERVVKGKEGPVKVYQVIAPSSRRTGFDVSAERGLTAFVGRERELELLRDGLERVKGGRGQAFSIMGEAGVGKSRLLYEFRKAVANEDLTFLEGKCLSYGRGTAYYPMIDILKSILEIQEGDQDPQVREKVKRAFGALGIDEAATLPFVLELLSVKDSGMSQISMSPGAKRNRIMEAFKMILLKSSQLRPLVIAIEDLHWMDKSSEDMARDILENISGSKILLLFTYRPEFVHTWGAKSYHSQLALHRLSNRESLELVFFLLGTRKVEKALEEIVLEKTEGVPFFIEEFIKSLKDLKVIEKKEDTYGLFKEVQQLTIPSTIQDVIMARVDSLPEGAKEVLQIGSVIEREFNYELLKSIIKLEEKDLLSRLSALKDSELLYERGVYPQSSYIFKHALTREVVYGSILPERKMRLHEQIGNAIEELNKGHLSGHYEVLSGHYFLSGNYGKGAEYSRLAGRKAGETASFHDAIVHAKRRVESLKRMPQTEQVQEQMIDARTMLGLYLTQMNYLVEAREAIEPIIELAIKRDYRRRLCQIYALLGSYYWCVEENAPEAFRVLEESLKISKEIKDFVSLVLASYWFGNALGSSCEYEKSAQHFQRALDINVAAKSLWGIAVIKSNLAYFTYWYQGKMDLAFKTSSEGFRIAEESGDIYSKTMAYVLHGNCCYGKGFLEEAEKRLMKGLEFCEKMAFFAFTGVAQFYLGEVYFERGDFSRAAEHYEKIDSAYGRHRLFPSWVNWGKVGFARAKVLNQEKSVDLESLYAYAAKNKVKAAEGWIRKCIAEILLNLGKQLPTEAEHWIQKAIEADQRNGVQAHLGKDYALYAEWSKRKGDRPQARENLGKAIAILKECGAEGWVTKYEKELASVS